MGGRKGRRAVLAISGLKREYDQPFLFPEPLRGMGHCRTVIGRLAERLTAELVGGVVHKTVAGHYCPDVSNIFGYFESKAVGRSNTAFVYAGRLVRDAEFVADGNRLEYVVWRHGASTGDTETVGELERLMLANLLGVYVIPFAAVRQICHGLRIEKLNSAYGNHLGSREMYGSGYRIPLKLLEQYERGI